MSLPKWAPKWEGPYLVSEVHPNGYSILLDPDHGTTTGPINFKYVKSILQCMKKIALAIIHSKYVNDAS
ncbi:hypothetical protein Ahy_B06g084456 [Arachis hypogaea]|uniref:Uncharacterized protein n=1 Tax=Arachis hypogaea TaxID=3818 RepID=A0A444YRX8_ARAHY|nr:hypothetical protein Ahy_B06g084456 [Arachis hypogaea]